MNLFNIGVEGQYTIASYAAAAIAGAAIFPGLLNVFVPVGDRGPSGRGLGRDRGAA